MIHHPTAKSIQPSPSGSALRIALVYGLVSCLWIALSDRVVQWLIPNDAVQMAYFQTMKGLAFVLTTAGIVFFLIRRRLLQVKRAEEDLAESRSLFTAFAGQLPGIALIKDEAGRYVFAGGRLHTDVVPSDGLVDHLTEEIWPPEIAARLKSHDQQVLRTGEPTQIVEMLPRGGVEEYWIASRFPLTTADGRKLVGIVYIDVTERQQAQDRLRLMATDLEEANRVKDRFLATLSHELRTPLTSIHLWIRLLKDALNGRPGGMDADTTEAVDMVEQGADAQSRIVDDLLDVSRIMTGKLRLEATPITLRSSIQPAVEAMRPLAEQAGVRLITDLRDTDSRICADAKRLHQVVWNLLSNAVKFTPAGGTVTVSLARTDGHALLTVADTGRGIAPEFRPFLFERFRQADSSTTRREGGLGIGLYICKHFIDQLGGTISVQSAGVGRGATFTVTLPLMTDSPAATRAPAAATEEKRFSGTSILVVEDQPEARDALAIILKRAGADVRKASSVAEALQLIEQDRPDILLSDVGLGGRDGFDLIQELHRQEADNPLLSRIRSAAVTAYAMPEDRDRALAAGFDLFIPKPIDMKQLMAAVADLASRAK